MSDIFTFDTAAALLPEVRRRADAFVALRADLTELAAALKEGDGSTLGGVADAKALEARVHEHLEWFTAKGIEIKGLAPLTLDFPAIVSGQAALLCWLENEPRIAWWHSADRGFAGRRPIPG